MANIITAIIIGLASIGCFVISYFQFRKKGYLFNNSYIFASNGERENVDKTPYYFQSGIIFTLLGLVFLVNTIDAILETSWLFYVSLGIIVIAIVYAIISSILIKKKKNK